MEHHNKYYLVKASEFDNRRARPPPTSYGEQRRHDIDKTYKDLLRELTDPSARVFDVAAEFRKKAQSALTEGVQEERKRMLPRLPDKPPLRQPRQASAEKAEEEAVSDRVPTRNPGSTVRRTPKKQRAARSELHSLLSPANTKKRGTKKKEKKSSVVKPREYWRY